jgi:hypothetical protein
VVVSLVPMSNPVKIFPLYPWFDPFGYGKAMVFVGFWAVFSIWYLSLNKHTMVWYNCRQMQFERRQF